MIDDRRFAEAIYREVDTADLSMPPVGDHPVAEPRGAAGGRSSNNNNIIIISVHRQRPSSSVRRQPELNEKEIGDGGQQAAPAVALSAGRSASCAHARNRRDRGQRGY